MGQFRGPLEFLSNFSHVPGGVMVRDNVFDGLTYPTIEHAFQAAKTLDPNQRRLICAAATPGQAKRLGRQVQLQDDWDVVKLPTMLDLLRQKFAPGSELALRLVATDPSLIIEWNEWHDVFWGRCTCPRHNGQGFDNLGRLLRTRRLELMGDPAPFSEPHDHRETEEVYGELVVGNFPPTPANDAMAEHGAIAMLTRQGRSAYNPLNIPSKCEIAGCWRDWERLVVTADEDGEWPERMCVLHAAGHEPAVTKKYTLRDAMRHMGFVA